MEPIEARRRFGFEELKGARGFTRPTSMSIGNDTFKSMSVDFADVNNDGIFDMFVSNIASPFAMQEGHFLWMSTGRTDSFGKGIAPWVDKADELGVSHSAWAWDARFEDFDNDGTVELAQATGLVRGKENRWPDLAQVGGANDSLVKHPASWPRFLPGSDVDGTALKPFWVRGNDGHYVNLASNLFPDSDRAHPGNRRRGCIWRWFSGYGLRQFLVGFRADQEQRGGQRKRFPGPPSPASCQ